MFLVQSTQTVYVKGGEGEYKSPIFFGDLFEADFVDLGIGDSTETNCRSDQRRRELHG